MPGCLPQHEAKPALPLVYTHQASRWGNTRLHTWRGLQSATGGGRHQRHTPFETTGSGCTTHDGHAREVLNRNKTKHADGGGGGAAKDTQTGTFPAQHVRTKPPGQVGTRRDLSRWRQVCIHKAMPERGLSPLLLLQPATAATSDVRVASRAGNRAAMVAARGGVVACLQYCRAKA